MLQTIVFNGETYKFKWYPTFKATIYQICSAIKQTTDVGGPTAVRDVKRIMWRISPLYIYGVTMRDVYASATNQHIFNMPDEETIDRCIREYCKENNIPRYDEPVNYTGTFQHIDRADDYDEL